MNIVSVKNLSREYKQGSETIKALDNVSFDIEKGEFIAIVGKSGSGKSTLLHLLGAVDTPTSGNVFINDIDVFSLDDTKRTIFRRQNIGLIYQFYNLIPILTVEENISLPLSLDNKKVDKEKLDDLIETLGLTHRKGHLPNQLSGGEQQRVAIGRALIANPSIVLADEATGNLDSNSSKEIIDLLKLCNEKYGQTIILITHDEKQANEAKRVITISDGKISGDTNAK